MDLPFDKKEPDFINEEGYKWWRDEFVTEIAQRPNLNDVSLDAVCFFVEEPTGRRTRILVGKDQEVLAEDQTLDGIGCKIDVLKLQKGWDNDDQL